MTTAPPARRAPRGFTLIELLVVIAIIALLAAILFPVFAKAREKARQTACLSNMSQIAKGLEMYKQDFDGYFPPSQLPQGCNLTSGLMSWPTLMMSYISSQDVFVCPSASDNTEEKLPDGFSGARHYAGVTRDGSPFGTAMTGDGSTADVGLVHRLSYGRNLIPDAKAWYSAGTANWGNNNPLPPPAPGCGAGTATLTTNLHKSGFVASGTTASINEAQVEAPATTIHIMDAMTGSATSYAIASQQGSSIRGIQDEQRTDHMPTNTASKVSGRHSGGFNAIYGDGHAHWSPWGTTKACDWTIQDDTCP